MAGGDNNLGVMIHSFSTRDVLCWGSDGPRWWSCNQLLYDMPTDQVPRVIGKPNDPAAGITVPFVIESSKSSPSWKSEQ